MTTNISETLNCVMVEHSLWSSLDIYRNWADQMATKHYISRMSPEICLSAFEVIKEYSDDSFAQ